ncbi:MAG: cell wall metabolism sensor histidine kinase WalK [Firmicutes bacterium]|nr:cell wall metabolism sensor histidine kinase WalK [Bacillota bacterium]
MFKSVQWKLVIIYTLIILFAMQFFVVFLSQALEDYYLDTFAENMESQGLLLVNFLERYLNNPEEPEIIDNLVFEYSRYADNIDIIVLDAFGRVISSSTQAHQLRGQRIIQQEITRALTGSRSEAIRLDPETNERMKYLALPIQSGGKNLGVVYLLGSLEPLYQTIFELKLIFLTGAFLAIGITVVLSFLLSRTITVPIQEVTAKARQIAHGDFRQRIVIRSEDEIGNLGEMFNYLSQQLDSTLREISSEKSKVEAILQHMTDGIVALGSDGQILHFNPAARKLLRLAPGQEPTPELLSPLLQAVDLNEIMQTGRQEKREIEISSKKQIILTYYVPFQTLDAGEATDLSGVLIVMHDVTKERELVRLQREFVANVSHELRTPLTTLKSYTETLLDGAMEQPQVCESFLQTMENEIERMVRLVKDLLDLSKLDHHQVGWNMKQYDLAEIIQEVVDDFRVKYKFLSRQLTVSFPEVPVVAELDRDRMKQVLLNVISNAYKYTQENGRIDITLTQTGDKAVILVADDGIGVPAEETERVFERFYRVDKTRSRNNGGTGLGLPIAREIVLAHQGTITMQSQLNEGATIRIELPLTQAGEAKEQCASA